MNNFSKRLNSKFVTTISLPVKFKYYISFHSIPHQAYFMLKCAWKRETTNENKNKSAEMFLRRRNWIISIIYLITFLFSFLVFLHIPLISTINIWCLSFLLFFMCVPCDSTRASAEACSSVSLTMHRRHRRRAHWLFAQGMVNLK